MKDPASGCTVGITMRLMRSLHLIGTGVLVDVEGWPFIVTAAHVVKWSRKYEGQLGFMDMNGNLIALRDNWECSALRSYDASCDPIDVAAQQIDPYLRDQLAHAVFLTSEDMDFTIRTSGRPYHLYGFPFSLIERDETPPTRLSLRPLSISFSAYSGSTHLIGGYDCQLHLLLDARGLDTQKAIGGSPGPEVRQWTFCSLLRNIKGISGCGVWREDHEKRKKIVALQTGVYHRHRVIKATRWTTVMAFLNESYPELISCSPHRTSTRTLK